VSTSDWQHSSRVYGNIQNNHHWGNSISDADAAIFYLSEVSDIAPTPSIHFGYVNSGQVLDVAAKASSALPEYLHACTRGARTLQEVCGLVQGYADWNVVEEDGPNSAAVTHLVRNQIWWEWNAGSAGATCGDSGGPFYSFGASNAVVALGIYVGGDDNCDVAGQQGTTGVVTPIDAALTATGTALSTIGRVPFWSVDNVSGGAGYVHTNGWIVDPDLIFEPTSIHVYLGGPAGVGEGHAVVAADERIDVALAYTVGLNHGFNVDIPTSLRGSVSVYIYAIDTGGTWIGNPLIGQYTVTVT
jgi:hypothetical protein